MIPTEGPTESSTPKQTKYPSSSGLDFKPLSDGLGFHLFADGLPYAPRGTSGSGAASAAPQTGTGATAAGRPAFAYPSPSAASASSADQAAERIRRELETIRSQLQASAPSPARPMNSPARIPNRPQAGPAAAPVNMAQKLAELESYGLGYVFRRFFAYLIDFAFMGSICGSVLSVALLNVSANDVGYISIEALLTAGVFLFGCIWAAIAAQEVAFGTSLGKRIFNLRLRGTGTDVFLRAVFFIPSLFFSGLGILMCLADHRKRCWHDRVTQIQPENG